jgi:uncharacterized SAM-binding protein YcdF (DUF218 family)
LRISRPILVAAIVFVALVVWAASWLLARALVVEVPLTRAEAILALAGAGAYGERVLYAARMFGEGRAPRVLLTDDGERQSWSRTLEKNPMSYERAELRLQAAGVPADRIVVLAGTVSSTYDEALRLKDYVNRTGIKSVIVVTSPYHTRRALWTMRHVLAGSDVAIGVEPAVPSTAPSATFWVWHLQGWHLVAGEFLKLIYYHAFHR